jgi:predicted nuclease of predicted toxin-antitoxin system
VALKFVADHCVSKEIVESLQDAGYDVYRLKDVMPVDSPDSAVILKAQELDSILLSLNGDFTDIVSYPPLRYKGIVSLQLRNHPETIAQLLERLKAYLSQNSDPYHYKGKLLLVEIHRIRVRE